MKPSESIHSNFEDLLNEKETGTNNRHVEYVFGTMKFEIADFKLEWRNLNNSCSISVTHNRPPKSKLNEFKEIMDLVFGKRLTVLRINLSFQNEEWREYLLEKLRENQTLSEVSITYMKEGYSICLLESLSEIKSLNYVELQCKIASDSIVTDAIGNYAQNNKQGFTLIFNTEQFISSRKKKLNVKVFKCRNVEIS